MTIIKSESFEGVTPVGATITTTNTNFDEVSIGTTVTAVSDSQHANAGTQSAKIVTTNSTGPTCYFGYVGATSIGAGPLYGARDVFFRSALPTVSLNPIRWETAGGVLVAQLHINTDGTLTISTTASTTAAGPTTGKITTTGLTRGELLIDTTNHIAKARLWYGTNVGGATFDEEIDTAVDATNIVVPGRVRFGNPTQNNNGTTWHDSIAAANDWPSAAAAVTAVQYRSGGAWVNKPLLLRKAGAWQ